MKKTIIASIFIVVFIGNHGLVSSMSKRSAEVGETTITDRTGEAWDISQAVREGFEPKKFQYGLGRNAIRPVGEERLSRQTERVPANLRVIGVEIEDEAVAVSVPALTRHEIANLNVGGRPVAVAY